MLGKKDRKNDYDAIIIGSGIGGLTAGAYLARKKTRALVCEQNHLPGGCFSSFTRKGYTFDGGIQGCEDSGMLHAMLGQLGIADRITLTCGKSAWAAPDIFVPFPTYAGLAEFYRKLEAVYPGEVPALREVSGEVQRLCRVFDGVFGAPNPGFLSFFQFLATLVKWIPRHAWAMKDMGFFLRLLNTPVDDYLKTKFKDPRPARMLSQTIYRGSGASFALPFFYFFTQYFYPRGGVQVLPNLLASYIAENGGEVRCKTLVKEIIFEDGKARGVKLESGETIRAPFVISNADARATFLKMLPPEATPDDYRERLRKSEVSESMFSVFLGVDIPPEKLPVQGCQHVFYLTSYDGVGFDDVEKDPDYYKKSFIMVMIPSMEDPTLAPPGKSVIILQTAAVREFANAWGAPDGKRTEEYKQIKEKVADQLIANVEKIIPGLSAKIEMKITASPLTYYRYTMNSGGATGGWSKHIDRTFGRGVKGYMNVFSPVKNLYLCGHWTSVLGGAPIGMTTGRMVAAIVNTKRKLGYR